MNATINRHQRKRGCYSDDFEVTYTAITKDGNRICEFMSICTGLELSKTHSALLLKTQSCVQDAGYTLY